VERVVCRSTSCHSLIKLVLAVQKLHIPTNRRFRLAWRRETRLGCASYSTASCSSGPHSPRMSNSQNHGRAHGIAQRNPPDPLRIGRQISGRAT
jgi:hypothetical protein